MKYQQHYWQATTWLLAVNDLKEFYRCGDWLIDVKDRRVPCGCVVNCRRIFCETGLLYLELSSSYENCEECRVFEIV